MVASLRQQYGLRVQSDEFRGMAWDEFGDLVAGLNEQTPLVRVAMIRTETDPEAIRQFSPEQRRMRREWQRRGAARRPQEEVDRFMGAFQESMARMFGGE